MVWSISKMIYDDWKKTEEFHFYFQNAVFELLHCEQYFLPEMFLVGFFFLWLPFFLRKNTIVK